MARMTLEQLGPLLRDRRGRRGLREVAKDIGISPATLSRVESGKQPDIDTFSKVCRWLQINPGEVLGCEPAALNAGPGEGDVFAVHLRAKKTYSPETARHLGELILAVQRALESERGDS